MGSRQYRVTLTGTWSRTNTLPEDITMMRRMGYQLRAAEARAVADAQEYPTVVFELKARHGRPTRLAQPREGTFTAHVRVPFSWGYQYLTGPQLRSRATQILRWFLADVTCRAPKVTVETSTGRTVAS